MRTITALFVTFVLVFTVDAGNPPPVTLNKCVGLIDEAKAKFDSLGNSFVSYSKSLNPSAYDKVNSVLFKPEDAYRKLKDDSDTTSHALENFLNMCCPLSDDPVAITISEGFKNYTLAAVAAFDALGSEVSAYEKNGDPYIKMKHILYDLAINIDPVNQCFMYTAPAAVVEEIDEYEARFGRAFRPVLNYFKVF